MLKISTTFAAVALALGLVARAYGQALPTATATGALQAGVGYSIATPDYGQKNITGATIFADYDIGLHYGVEFDAHIMELNTPTDIAENSYLVGPRVILPYRGRFNLYGKALFGVGQFKVLETQDNQGQYDGNYLAYALGGGLDIRVAHHIVVRAIDLEYQKWPNYGRSGLTPVLYTFGVAYHFR